ncbi:MAG: hemolysin III family protein [Spirochaetia bacterium]|nr:hemolysin III family protein [Spirochaetia bacterium]
MYRGERFNSITHLIGALFGVTALSLLVFLAYQKGDVWKIISFSIYGTTLFLLYLFSTLYHSLRGKAKNIFRKIDYVAIYFFIAGTYTPFTLISLRNNQWGWILFGLIWGLAAIGILIEVIKKPGKLTILPVFIYLGMGWLIMLAINPLMEVLSSKGFILLASGGVLYTVGVLFFSLDKKLQHAHGIWHLFVLGGSICHFVCLLLYVL